MQTGQIKTVLVTGANGFIGSRVCRLLAASGYAVRILCRETSDLKLLADIPYTKAIGDITKPDSLPPALFGVDYVIHLAGLVKARKVEQYFEVNQKGTLNLVNTIKNHSLPIRKFVLVSSAAAGGPSTGRPRTEADPAAPLTTYGRSKLAAEEAIRPFFDLLPITILRPPGVYGPGDTEIFTLFDMVNKGLRVYMAGGHNRVQLIYVDDLARAIKAAMCAPQSCGRVYTVAAAEAHTIRDMLDMIGRLLDKRGIALSLPLWLVNFIAVLSEVGSRLLGRTPHFSREKVRELTTDWEFDVSKAAADFGFEANIDFETGARLTIDWYRREGWLS